VASVPLVHWELREVQEVLEALLFLKYRRYIGTYIYTERIFILHMLILCTAGTGHMVQPTALRLEPEPCHLAQSHPLEPGPD
jgi:hypothetical protein